MTRLQLYGLGGVSYNWFKDILENNDGVLSVGNSTQRVHVSAAIPTTIGTRAGAATPAPASKSARHANMFAEVRFNRFNGVNTNISSVPLVIGVNCVLIRVGRDHDRLSRRAERSARRVFLAVDSTRVDGPGHVVCRSSPPTATDPTRLTRASASTLSGARSRDSAGRVLLSGRRYENSNVPADRRCRAPRRRHRVRTGGFTSAPSTDTDPDLERGAGANRHRHRVSDRHGDADHHTANSRHGPRRDAIDTVQTAPGVVTADPAARDRRVLRRPRRSAPPCRRATSSRTSRVPDGTSTSRSAGIRSASPAGVRLNLGYSQFSKRGVFDQTFATPEIFSDRSRSEAPLSSRVAVDATVPGLRHSAA